MNSKTKYYVELICVFAVFAAASWSFAPDLNESHYLTRAKAFWDSDWCKNDLFLASKEAHLLYVCSLGSLCNWFDLPTVAWTGRVIGWMLLAIGWHRLMSCFVERSHLLILSAGLMVSGLRFNAMAGEWLFGGIEAKVIAFGFVFIALSHSIQKSYSDSWIYAGLAIGFHAVVGIWAALGLIGLRCFDFRSNLPCRTEVLFAAMGVGISLLGIVPGLMLNLGIDSNTISEAAQIQVNQRLPHHLLITHFPASTILVHVAFLFFWLFQLFEIRSDRELAIHRFAFLMLGISVCGLVLNWGMQFSFSNQFCTNLLRYYWFRMGEVFLPIAIIVCVLHRLIPIYSQASTHGLMMLSLWVMAISGLVIHNAGQLTDPRSGADQQSLPGYETDHRRTVETQKNWVSVCEWIRKNTDRDAIFITPRQQQTFKWFAHRAEVVNWKDAPQNADGIVEWWARMHEIYGHWNEESGLLWRFDPDAGRMVPFDDQLLEIARRYNAKYLVVPQRHVDLRAQENMPIQFKQLYPAIPENKSTYVVFELQD